MVDIVSMKQVAVLTVGGGSVGMTLARDTARREVNCSRLNLLLAGLPDSVARMSSCIHESFPQTRAI